MLNMDLLINHELSWRLKIRKHLFLKKDDRMSLAVLQKVFCLFVGMEMVKNVQCI